MTRLPMPSPLGFSWLFRAGVVVACSAVVLAVASPARAYPEFPGEVDKALGLTCPPPCTICHLMTTPQKGDSADQLFANNVRASATLLKGGPYDEDFIRDNIGKIVLRLEQAPCPNEDDKSCEATMPCGVCNTDGAGEGDIVEIRAGQNPNNSSELPCVEYGCGSRIAPERANRPLDATAALFALGAALVLARRFRR